MKHAEKSPHILFILTDQQRADCMGCAGHPLLQTPQMDRLAAEGVHFTNCFTTSPLCVPARLSLATGLYPNNSNLWQNDSTCPLDADTYVQRLRRCGYRTCSIGKNHLFPMENCDLYANEPLYRQIGFDHIEDLSGTWGIIGGRSIYTEHLEKLGLLDGVRQYLGELEGKPDQERRFVAEALPLPAGQYIDPFIAGRVEKYLAAYQHDQPSFVYVGFQGPHEPWDAPDEDAGRYPIDRIADPIPEVEDGDWLPERSHRYQRWAQYYQPEDPAAGKRIAARYFGKIAQVDAAIAGILEAYQRKGWLDHTVVVFASDHGEMLGDLGRLSKSVFYESALRVPLIIRLPGCPRAGTVCQANVETIDLYSTLVDIAGGEPNQRCDSASLLPLLRGETDRGREDVLSEVHAHYMLRTREWKLVVGRDGQTLQLFDLEHDPLEQSNLCGHPQYAERELEMRSRLLTRITLNTYRPGTIDAEYSGHSSPGDTFP